MYTKCNTTHELDALFVFCDYQQTMNAFEEIKKHQFFAKIIPTPKEIFPAESLSIAVKKEDFDAISTKLAESKITPIKTVILKKCVLSYFYNVI